MVPAMSVLGHTDVSSRSDGELYISSVFLWWSSLGTSPVTGSLLFAAPVCGGIVLRLSRVLADFLLWTVDSVSWTTSGDRLVLGMATGNGQPKADRSCTALNQNRTTVYPLRPRITPRYTENENPGKQSWKQIPEAPSSNLIAPHHHST